MLSKGVNNKMQRMECSHEPWELICICHRFCPKCSHFLKKVDFLKTVFRCDIPILFFEILLGQQNYKEGQITQVKGGSDH